MKAISFRVAVRISKWIGSWFLSILSRFIAAGYYSFLPGRVRESARFYRALFPERSRFHAYACVWHQYQRFTRVFLDRMLMLDFDRISVTIDGWEALQQTLLQKKGAILLMSHMGNWDVAAHLLKKKHPGLRLLLYMGIKNREQIEKIQKESLAEQGIKIIAVNQNSSSPFHLIEAHTFLSTGGLVSLTGDRIWHESQRAVKVDFLGHEVCLPESPHLLALISERPIFALFPIKTGKLQYHIRISPPITVKAENRGDRKNAVKRSAQTYADLLSDAARRDPFEWFHFEPFLGKPLQPNNGLIER
ncbi:lysophospholipid acyltransferase family protein [bacterium]|nr:lysophospholipid acyltransferase family protein [bacterium]